MHFEFDIQRNCHTFQDLSEPHFHNGYEILVCLADGGKFTINNNIYPLCRGVVFLVKKGDIHNCIVDIASYDRYILHISYESLWQMSSMQCNFSDIFESANPYTVFNDEQLETISNLMNRCMNPGNVFGREFSQDIALMEIILYLGEHLNNGDLHVEPTQSKDFAKVVPIINYIHDHYMEEIALEQLSRDFFISKYHLCRLFKSNTGFSVGSYVTNYRIRQACSLLRKGISVQEAGELVGFRNNAHFISVFKKIIGTPPGKYSKNFHSNEEGQASP